LIALNFSVAPILLGYVLGPLVEENFRRALLLSGGSMNVFIERPISAVFVGISALVVLAQLFFYVRGRFKPQRVEESGAPAAENAISSPASE
jgi:TctA family transporter